MNIYKTDNKSFGAVVRIKNTPENKQAIEKAIIPIYHTARKQPITFFVGANPFRDAFISTGIKAVASARKCSEEWVIQNAELNGVNINERADDEIRVVSGFNDCYRLMVYLAKYMKSNFGKIDIFKAIKLGYKNVKHAMAAQTENKPSHLLPLMKALIDNEEESKRFNEKCLKDSEIKTAESISELLDIIIKNN